MTHLYPEAKFKPPAAKFLSPLQLQSLFWNVLRVSVDLPTFLSEDLSCWYDLGFLP